MHMYDVSMFIYKIIVILQDTIKAASNNQWRILTPHPSPDLHPLICLQNKCSSNRTCINPSYLQNAISNLSFFMVYHLISESVQLSIPSFHSFPALYISNLYNSMIRLTKSNETKN